MLTELFKKRFSELTKDESVDEISNKADLTPKYVKDLLKGKQYPDIFDLYSIADAYGISIDYLLGRTEEKEPAAAVAGQAHIEKYNTNNIAQSEEVVKNFTDFLPILLEFARQYFKDIQVIQVSAHDYVGGDKMAKITFADSEGNKYSLLLEVRHLTCALDEQFRQA